MGYYGAIQGVAHVESEDYFLPDIVDEKEFVLTYIPLSGTERVYLNGLKQIRVLQYTLSSATVTFNVSTQVYPGDIVNVTYGRL